MVGDGETWDGCERAVGEFEGRRGSDESDERLADRMKRREKMILAFL